MNNFLSKINKKRGEVTYSAKNKGFFELIIIIIIALLLMKYSGVTVSTVVHYIEGFIKWFTDYFKDILK